MKKYTANSERFYQLGRILARQAAADYWVTAARARSLQASPNNTARNTPSTSAIIATGTATEM